MGPAVLPGAHVRRRGVEEGLSSTPGSSRGGERCVFVFLPTHPLLLAPPPPSPAGGRSNLQAAAAEEEQRHVLTEENGRRSRVSAACVRFINSFASPFVSCSLLAPNPSSPGSISAFRIPEEQTNCRQRFLRPVLRCCPRVSNFMRFPLLPKQTKKKRKNFYFVEVP